jgi:hypothetical protein
VINQPVVVQQVVQVPIERVPIEHALGVGWDGTKRRFLLILAVLAISGFFVGIPTLAFYFGYEMIQRHLLLVILLSIYQLVVSAVVWLGIIKMALHVNRQLPFTGDDFLAVGAQLPSFLGVCILRGILLGIGYMCFVIPGIILHVKLDQADYFVVDRKMGPVAALEASWRVTNGAVLMLWLFGLVTGFVQFIGWCAFLIGALPAHMVVILSKAHIYDNLVATTNDATLIGKLAFSTPAETAILVAQPNEEVASAAAQTAPPAQNAAVPQSGQALAEIPLPAPTDVTPLSDVPFLERPSTETSHLSDQPFLEQQSTETAPLSDVPFLEQPFTPSTPLSEVPFLEQSGTESSPATNVPLPEQPPTESSPTSPNPPATESSPTSDGPLPEQPSIEGTPPSAVSFFDPPSSDAPPPSVPPNIATES